MNMRRNSPFGAALSFALLAWCHAANAAPFVVTTTDESGPGSLRQAILDANATPGPDTITFNIPGAGERVIDVSANFLPDVTDTVTIDGYTQPGSSPNTRSSGSNATVLVRIDGGYNAPTFSAPAGLRINAPDCVIRGLMLTRFARYTFGHGGGGRLGGFGLEVNGDRCVVAGNYIGVDKAGSADLGNIEAGIRVSGADVRVGGDLEQARNVIGGNGMGVYVTGAQRPFIQGNQIGTNPTMINDPAIAAGAPNDIGIVLGGDSVGAVIGSVTVTPSNLISGNRIGIRTAYTNPGTSQTTIAQGALIQGNFIGLQPDAGSGGEKVNQKIGIEVIGTDHLIGGLTRGVANRIAFNETGIRVVDAASGAATERNQIFSNSIYANAQIGIDLAESSISTTGESTSNDPGDADTGPNQLQNFPIVTSVSDAADKSTIRGVLQSTPSATFTLQFFRMSGGDVDQTLIATDSVTTDATGYASFVVETSLSAPIGNDRVAATATDPAGNTSELSPENGPVQLANIATRAFVGADANRLFGGFIIRSEQPKKVAVRALGPSIAVPNRLGDPSLEIYDRDGALRAKNDDWKAGGQQEEVSAVGLAPGSDVESVIIITLPAGEYTAQVFGVNGGTGNGIVEVYDLDPFPDSTGRLINISTRAFVGTGDNLLIGGVIVRGDAAQNVVLRAIGPGLASNGVPNAMQDPVLELRDSGGSLVAVNDDWAQNSGDEIPAALRPGDSREAAIAAVLAPGNYTGIVSGKQGATGVALVEFYDVKN